MRKFIKMNNKINFFKTIFILLIAVLSIANSYCQSAGKYSLSGYEAFKSKHFPVAIDYYSIAIELDPKNADAYFYRGYSKANLEDYRGAILDFNKAIKLDPQNGYAYYKRGFSKLTLKDYAGAILDYTKAIGCYKRFSYLNNKLNKH